MKRLALALVPLMAISGAAFAQGMSTPTNQPAQPISQAQPARPMQQAPVQPLAKMTPGRGYSGDAAGHRATTALNLLGAKGYGNFTNFHRDGRLYQATVTQGGQQFMVTVNPSTGSVTRG